MRPGTLDTVDVNGTQVSFRNACDKHDICYYTVGTSASDCNSKFLSDLTSACDALLGDFIAAPLFIPCMVNANSIAGATIAKQEEYHSKAQASQKDYLSRIEKYVEEHADPFYIDIVIDPNSIDIGPLGPFNVNF